MASSGGRTDSSLAETLFEESFRFDFFQAVRLLQRINSRREAVGKEAEPREEVVRFRAHISLTFPPSAIYDISDAPDPAVPPEMVVAFMGLAGLLGVLPRHYTETLLERMRYKDFTLRDFLDLFNHRLISFFYRAWEKYRFPIAYERAVLKGDQYDPVSLYLFHLFGMGTQGLRERLDVKGETLLFYSGRFAQQPHSANALEALIGDYFEVPVRAHQFIGQWLPLTGEQRACLAAKNPDHCLGAGAILGARFWDQQAKFKLQIGPVSFAQFRKFLPLENGFKKLVQLTRLMVGQALDFEVQLVLQAAEVPGCRIATADPSAARLGWTSWLKTREFAAEAGDAVMGSHWTRV
jgi:type VI secretion system protein ImpH